MHLRPVVFYLVADVVDAIKSLGPGQFLCELVERVHWTQHAEDMFVDLLTNLHSSEHRERKPSTFCFGAEPPTFNAPAKPLTEQEKLRIVEERSDRVRRGLIMQPGPRKKRMRMHSTSEIFNFCGNFH